MCKDISTDRSQFQIATPHGIWISTGNNLFNLLLPAHSAVHAFCKFTFNKRHQFKIIGSLAVLLNTIRITAYWQHWSCSTALHLLTENQIRTLSAQPVRTAHCFFHISMFFLWALVKWSQTFLWQAAEKTLSIWPTDRRGETSTVRRNNNHPAQGGSFLLALHQSTYLIKWAHVNASQIPLSILMHTSYCNINASLSSRSLTNLEVVRCLVVPIYSWHMLWSFYVYLEMPCINPGWDTDYINFSRYLFSPFRQIPGLYLKCGQDCFLSHPFQFFTHTHSFNII